jgi:hypothetical protein
MLPKMIPLDSPEWSRLNHAYGTAEDLPKLLQVISGEPDETGPSDDEAWSELWSCLCHQGDVYTASVAAVPHLIQAGLRCTPDRLRPDYILLPVSIEKARMRRPEQLKPGEIPESYWSSLLLLDSLASAATTADFESIAQEAKSLLMGRHGSLLPDQKSGRDLGDLFRDVPE